MPGPCSRLHESDFDSVWVSEWVNVGFFHSFSWSLSLSRYSSWLLFKHESLIKCDGLWQWCNPAICYTANTHTWRALRGIHVLDLMLGAPRVGKYVVIAVRKTNSNCCRTVKIFMWICDVEKEKRESSRKNTAVRLPLHRWNNLFEKYRRQSIACRSTIFSEKCEWKCCVHMRSTHSQINIFYIRRSKNMSKCSASVGRLL